MSTKVHVGGLSYFCTDHTLRQAFIPFGTVVHAQVLRDECGHSLGLGVVHMACAEEVERVFNEHQRFEVSGSRVDLWEPAEPESPSHRVLAFTMRETPATQTGQDPGPEENQKARNPLPVRSFGLIRTRGVLPRRSNTTAPQPSLSMQGKMRSRGGTFPT
jgi:cold-inducible RNA-binding protein